MDGENTYRQIPAHEDDSICTYDESLEYLEKHHEITPQEYAICTDRGRCGAFYEDFWKPAFERKWPLSERRRCISLGVRGSGPGIKLVGLRSDMLEILREQIEEWRRVQSPERPTRSRRETEKKRNTKDQVTALQAQLQSANEKIEELEQALARLQTTLHHTQGERDEFRDDSSTLRAENDRFKEEIIRLRVEVARGGGPPSTASTSVAVQHEARAQDAASEASTSQDFEATSPLRSTSAHAIEEATNGLSLATRGNVCAEDSGGSDSETTVE